MKNRIFSGQKLSPRALASAELQVQRAYLSSRIQSLKKQNLLRFSGLKNVNPSFYKAKGNVEEIQAQTEQIKKILASPLSSSWDIKMKRGKLTLNLHPQPARPPQPAPKPDRPSRRPVEYEDYEEDYEEPYDAGIDVDDGGTGPEAPTSGPGAHDRYSDIMDMIPEDDRDDVRDEYDSQDVFWLGDIMINQDMSIDEARDAFDKQKERRLEELDPERSPEPF